MTTNYPESFNEQLFESWLEWYSTVVVEDYWLSTQTVRRNELQSIHSGSEC